MKHHARALAALATTLLPGLAAATDGYFAHGYGMKSLGMGGAGIARTDDAFGGANNPAQFAFVPDQLDLGLTLFKPTRSATRSGAALPGLNGTADGGSSVFELPEAGYVHRVDHDWALGVTVYGNGGMNTDYGLAGGVNCSTQSPPPSPAPPSNLLCGSTGLGIDMAQLIVAPTVGWKVDERQSLGVSLLVVEQRFKATGLQMLANFQLPTPAGTIAYSSDPSAVTDKGYSYSSGVGARLGYLGRLAPDLTLGLSYSPKVSMGKLSKYRGLFAQQGGFDIPVNYGLGLQYRASERLTVALDVTRILYAGIASVGNPGSNAGQLGSDNGPGFGWRDVTAVKLGVEGEVMPGTVLRAGINHGTNPITPRDVTFNILAPGVVQEHFTLGGTHALGNGSSIGFAFAFMPGKSVSGPSALNGLFQATGAPAGTGGNETIRLSEKQLGVSWETRL